MPITEFPAIISLESILRGGTGSFSERRAADGSHGRQIPPTPAPDQRQSARHATTRSHRGRIPRNPDGHSTLSARRVTAKSHSRQIPHESSTKPAVSARHVPMQPHRGQITGFKPPTDNHRRPPATAHDGNKKRPASNDNGRPERHHRPGRPSSRPLTDAGAQVSGIHPASSYLLFRSSLLKRLIEVGNQIIRILNTHGQTHQVRWNLKRRPGHRSVGHGRRQLNQGFHAAE